MCNKFKKFGLQKFNKNKSGCTEECEFYHPRACFEALKTKTCRRADCRFFHLTGTKREEGSSTNSEQFGNPGNCNTGNNNSNGKNNNVSNNLNNSQQTSTAPVFQEARQPWDIAIERMANQMEKMMSLQQSFQTQIQPLLQPQRAQINSATNPNW